MKNIILLAFSLNLFLVSSCSHDSSQDSGKLEKALAGLTKLTLKEKEKWTVLGIIHDSVNVGFPVYSLQGELLTQAQIREKEMNVTVDCYGPSFTDIKAVVFRDLTKEELKEIFKDTGEGERYRQTQEALIGTPAPVFSTKDIHGKAINLAALKGKVVVLNFWFVHCFACVQEMPELNQIMQENSGQDVTFIGLTFDSKAETQAFLQHTRFDYRQIAEAQPIFDLFNVKPCPTNMVIDKTGRIVFIESGYTPFENQSYKNLTGAIKEALTK